MPIYAYRCSACGHAQDVLQKISDPLLTQCPACGQATYAKQVTAAGFQLKGSGWYATDFRNGTQGKAPPAGGDAATPTDKAGDKPSEPSADKAADKTAQKPAEPAKTAKPAADKGSAASPTPAAPAGNG